MDLELRVDALEKRIKHLEQQLNTLLEKEHKSDELPLHAISTTPETIAPVIDQPHSPVNIEVKPPAPSKDWEHLIARVWLPRIFILVFLLGVLWGFTAAVGAGLITQPIRCILGVAVAGLMYWQGEVQIRRNRTALGQVLFGGASGVLMLSLFAAHMLFDLIPSGLAFILYLISLGGSVYSALRHRSQALMIITLLAGYLVPFLVETAKPNIWAFVGYETLFSIAMLLLSLRYAFRGAYYVAFGVLHVPLLFGLLLEDGTDNRAAILTAICLQHIVLFALSVFSSNNRQLGKQITLFLSFGLLVSWMYGLYGHSSDRLTYEWMLVVWSLLYSGTSFWFYSQKKSCSIHLSIATFSWFLWLIYVLHTDQTSSAVLAEGSLALYLGVKLKSRLQQLTGTLAYVFGAVSVLVHPIAELFSAEAFAWLVLIASIGGLYRFIQVSLQESKGKSKIKLILLWAELVLCLIFLSQITNVLTDALTYDYQHLVLSAVWAVYAIILIIFGVIVKKPKARLVGILFLFVTLLKIIFVDLPDVSTTVRAILFIGLGSVGVVISRLLYKR
ncbi:DUF2339 domain-containing protein [Paenibacillus sp. SYP-B3998]|uniref:DUF2339 domain-containing protein n=1 Tax=Paenibacillus sp. SYP-B3998 TaxID=2678564 RepID=A0A6G3ZZS6_9BACL|nr:DUF2339 domain-containing protein [Paenibacillus sp. SYP-B3998]NEW07713.1 DUF2339 domain-containing protein [Paenibacillus sp. SYP-B3998]